LTVSSVQILALDAAFLCPPYVRPPKQYLLDFFRAYAMFGLDLVDEPIFPDDLL